MLLLRFVIASFQAQQESHSTCIEACLIIGRTRGVRVCVCVGRERVLQTKVLERYDNIELIVAILLRV